MGGGIEMLKPIWVMFTTFAYGVGSFMLIGSAALRLMYAVGYDDASPASCTFPRMVPHDDDSALYYLLVPWIATIVLNSVMAYISNPSTTPVFRISVRLVSLLLLSISNIIAIAIHMVTYCTPYATPAMVVYVQTGIGMTKAIDSIVLTEIMEHRVFLVAIWLLQITTMAMDLRVIRTSGTQMFHLVPTSSSDEQTKTHFFSSGVFDVVARCVFFGLFCGLFGFGGQEFPAHSQDNIDQLGVIRYSMALPPFDASTDAWFATARTALIEEGGVSHDTFTRVDNLQSHAQTHCLSAIRNASDGRAWGKFPEAFEYAGHDPHTSAGGRHLQNTFLAVFIFCLLEFVVRIAGAVSAPTRFTIPPMVVQCMTYGVMFTKTFGRIMLTLGLQILVMQNNVHNCPTFTYHDISVQYLMLGAFAYCIVDHLITSIIDSVDDDQESDIGTFLGLRAKFWGRDTSTAAEVPSDKSSFKMTSFL
jgi:hypothetical protein